MKTIHRTLLEYFFIFIIWLIIFGKNVFSRLLFVDYVPSTFFDLAKNLQISDYTYRISLFDFFKFLLSQFNLIYLTFTLSILLAMFFSYYYIKKLSPDYSLLFALVLFFNPFIYSKIMIGQLFVILSFILMPVYVYYLFNLFEKDSSYKSIIKLALALTIVSMFQIQFFFFCLLLFLIAIFILISSKQKTISMQKYGKITIIFLILILLINSYWLSGFFSNNIFSQIDSDHESFFAPKSGIGVSAITKIIGMWGFWREIAYITPYQIIPLFFWYIMLLVLVLLLLWGYYNDLHPFRAKFFFSIWWIGLILATGISHPFTAPIFDFLFKNFPFFNGFRDSHKFIALTALAYAYFIPQALKDIKERLFEKNREKSTKLFNYTITFFAFLFIFVYTFPMIFLSNQITPVDYPLDYFSADSFLQNQQINGYIIYLPWQTYLTYNWTQTISSDGRIANPINAIIHNRVIQGSDRWGSNTKLTSSISECIEQKSIECLKSNNVEYIIKDTCTFYPDNYPWISYKKVYTGSCLLIYKLEITKPIETEKIPLRFIIGTEISFISLIIMIYLLLKDKISNKVQALKKRGKH